jgi:phospho-N-acetylmuramoyl-pentapeptide-transferase
MTDKILTNWQITGSALALGLTLLCGWIGLPLLRRLGARQTVRDDGPKTHYVKSGTPTFGGLFFLVPLTIVTAAGWLIDGFSSAGLALLLLTLAFGLAGFLDDFIKVRINKKGLSVRQKTILLLIFAVAFTLIYLFALPTEPFLILPGRPRPLMIAGWWKGLYGVLVVLYLFFIANSVNLTDGVDGLASSVTILSSLALTVTGLLLARRGLATDLTAPAAALSLLLAAGCLGFLFFNHHPARVFMGDTGSQALGAAIAGIALFYGVPWLLLLVGFVYIAESLSVMIQVAYFRHTGGRRIFRMSPIHHHFELGGWSEVKVVTVFSAVCLAFCLLGLWLVSLI